MYNSNDKLELSVARSYKVVKSNDIIQKARSNLTELQQKIIAYIVSRIKPGQSEFTESVFDIVDFCKVCGIDSNQGKNYSNIKRSLKGLRDKSEWVTLDDGDETILSWFDNVRISPKSGKVTIKLNDLMKPYLLMLKDNFTEYELIYILAMSGKYSIRLYELLKSLEWKKRDHIFDIDDLKSKLFAEKYVRYPDFTRKVLDVAVKDINEYSDIFISYSPIKQGKKYSKILFTVRIKVDIDERLDAYSKIENKLDPPQQSFFAKEDPISKLLRSGKLDSNIDTSDNSLIPLSDEN